MRTGSTGIDEGVSERDVGDEDFWKRKLCSLLHDPPIKAYNILEHKKLAKELADSFGVECDKLSNIVNRADMLAAASDRIPFLKSDREVDWSSSEAVLYHPLSSGTDKSGGAESNLLSDRAMILRINDVALMRQENLKNVSAELSATYNEIHFEIKKRLIEAGNRLNDPRRKFLWLWRNIAQLHGEKGYRRFILSWLPAETRLPDHSIYDHLITASSFAVEGQMTLIGVDIGGVQEFIKQSRKVRDLWASSYIISMLSTAGMMAVVERLGPDSIIHPDLRGAPLIDLYLFKEGVLTKEELESLWGSKEEFSRVLLISSIPGSFTFVAPSSEVDSLLNEIERRIKKLFGDLLDFLRETLGLSFELRHDLPYPLSLRFYRVPILNLESENMEFEGLGSDKDRIKEKLKNIIPREIYETYKSDGGDLLDHLAELIALRNERKGYRLLGTLLYQVAYSVLQAGIASQKLTSDFEYAEEPSVEDGEPVRRRCKLCGVRNPIPKWEEQIERLRSGGKNTGWAGWLLDEDEPLCPFCLAKRLLRSFYGDKSPLLKVWGNVIGCDEKDIRDLLKKLNLLEPLSKASAEIPTLDDIAVAPLKREINRRLEETEVSEKWNYVVSKMAQAVAAAVRIFYGSRRESDTRRHSLYIVSEVMREFPMLAGSEEVLADFIAEKLRTEFKDPREVPGTYYFLSVWENLLSSISGEGRWGREVECLNDLLKSLRELYEKLKMEPSNYVTYFLSDGDRLGYWISGRMFFEKGIMLENRLYPDPHATEEVEKTAHIARFVTPSLHRTMSRIVRGLAQDVYPYIVDSLDGLVIYSGGDDLMAVVPASNTLKILEMIHSCYSAEVLRLPDGKILMSMGRLATLSSGAVIAHRLLPMSEMLEKLREEEEFAKKERDRCSVVRLTRGLSEERAVLAGKILRVTESFRMTEGADLIFQSIDKEELSRSFLRDLMGYLDLYSSVYSSAGDEDLLRGFIRRAVERNIHVPDEKRRKELRDKILNFYENLMRIEAGRLDPLMNFHRALLMISREVV